MEKELCGVILVNKHKGVTSHDIVFKMRKLFGTKRVGHTGTLDPLAVGVLPVLIGRAAKAAEYLLCEDKEYVAELQLGITTDTEDITGQILSRAESLPTKEEFFDACSHFVGEIKQIPPMYSALKVNGQKLLDLARQGIVVEREARDITVFGIEPEVVHEQEGIYRIRVRCSKGTYIRTLCADIGAFLGCGATMTQLERTKSGGFRIENAYTVSQLEAMEVQERNSLLMPVESLFEEAAAVVLPDFYSRLCRSGCQIYQKKIGTDLLVGQTVRICDKNGFFALGRVMEYEEGTAIKAIKLFVL